VDGNGIPTQPMNPRHVPNSILPPLDWALALCLASLFAAAAVPKIVSPYEFSEIIWRYELLPDFMVNITAIYLPWIEIVCAFALVIAPRNRVPAYALLAVLMVFFTVATGFNLLRGISTPCGCFGSSDLPATWWHVARNLFITAIIGIASWVNYTKIASLKR